MIPNNKVKDLILKHSYLEKELSSGEIDKKNFASKSKEYAELSNIINEAKEYDSFNKNKNDLEKIINDKNSDEEMKELAKNELEELIKKMKLMRKKLNYICCQKMKLTRKMQL